MTVTISGHNVTIAATGQSWALYDFINFGDAIQTGTIIPNQLYAHTYIAGSYTITAQVTNPDNSGVYSSCTESIQITNPTTP